jgi:hypothetical protein
MMAKFFDMVTRAVTGHGTTPGASNAPPPEEPREPSRGIGITPVSPSRPVIGYINTGLYKVERVRRQARMVKQYHGALRTISLTRRAIRRTPRGNRYLFKGYYTLLKEARGRIKGLYAQINHTHSHLRTYDPFALEDEVKRLEATARSASSPAQRAEIELRLESRRALLDSVRRLDEKLEELFSQLSAIASTLELNHLRVVQIASQASYRSGADMLENRMQEVSEQLSLLEESLRELGG